jgi:uncharacterized protein YjbI with pentapeptide repeats
MENLNVWKEDYPFEDIKIKTPKALQGGTYCAKLELGDEPIIIQTPKCKTKNGIHKTAKQIYCDLLLTQDNIEFINWLSDFQERVRDLIIEKSDNWFHEPISLDEIEYNWNDSIRTYKSTNYLIRSFVHKNKRLNKIGLQIYDSDENEVSLDDVDSNKDVICIIEIVGLKFSSQSFSLEICLRQMMVMNAKPIFNKCLIRTDKSKNKIVSNDNQNVKTKTENVKDMEKKSVKLEENTHEHVSTEASINESNINESSVSEASINESNINESSVSEASVNESNINESSVSEASVNKSSVSEANVSEANVSEANVSDVDVDDRLLNNIVDSTSNKEIVIEESSTNKDINKSLEKTDNLEEIELKVDEMDTINIKEPNEVYLDIYKAAKQKAKAMKNEAIKAYLEAKRIKELYMLDIVDSSEEDDEEEEELFSEN